MKNAIRSLGIFVLAAIVPSVSLAQTAKAPLRTLVYHFEMDARGFGGSEMANAQTGSTARSGKIKVEVVQAAGDGGLVVDVTESVDRQFRDMEKVRCAIYGKNLQIICDQNLFATQEETALLSYLGRGFLNVEGLDEKQHWHVITPWTNMHEDSDFTIIKTDGSVATIQFVQKKRGGLSGAVEDTNGTMVYDSAMSVPSSVKLSTSRQGGGAGGDMNVKLNLVSDSMAPASSTNSH